MPKYNPTADDMDEAYGGDTAAAESAPAKAADETVDQENAEEMTALVSNKILSPEGEPLKEGDEIVVKIVKNYGDESEIMYAPKKEQTGTEEPMTEEPSTEAKELSALSEESA